ncbi:hypothetical protein HPB49_013877 [Dermacentor silvarum]|uniref:Uncharacterized protein n=1 Tax=Dermacentor silvarum TaxID=543639 RepID=A0ACB8DPK5_DERSI|nr:hypothetical protein HPB49_013877 [Dermacentor silvarum]
MKSARCVAISKVSGISEQLSRMQVKEGVEIAHKTLSMIAGLLQRPKVQPSEEKCQGIGYQVSCSKCPAFYVGETNSFPHRIRQHKNNIRKLEV